jgi:hypothetical protein
MINAYVSVHYVSSSILQDLRVGDKEDCVGPLFSVADALGQSSDFVGEGMSLIVLVFGAFDEVPILHGCSCVGVDDGACPMLCIGCNFRLEGSINIFVVIVGEHRGDEVGAVFHWYDVSFRIAWFFLDEGRGSGVATLGGVWGRSRLIRVVFGRGPGSSGLMTWVGSSGLP